MKKLISSDKGFYILFAFALILRIICEINNPVITSDNSIQLESAKNFAITSHFSHTWVNAGDLSQIQSSPMKLWPVGSPFILYALNWFTGDLIFAEILFQCLAIILFFSGSIRLFKYFGVPVYYINLFLLLYAFNASPFYYLGSTDLFTAAIFLYIIYYSMWELRSAQFKFKNIFIISLLTFITAVVRLACIPNLVIIPLLFWFVALYSKKRAHLMQGAAVLILSGSLVFVFYKFYPFDNSRTGFLKVLLSGDLFYSHLKWFDPFPIKALFFTRPFEFHLPYNPGIIFMYRISLVIISFGFLLFLLSQFIPRLNLFAWLREYKKNMANKNYLLILLFFVTSAVIIGFMSMQSLTTGPEKNSFGPAWMPPLWTFVYTTRYFIYLLFLIIIIYFIAYNLSEKSSKKIRTAFNYSYFAFLVWAFVYWLFMNYQFYSPKGNGAGSEWVNEKTGITAFYEIKKIKKENPSSQIVCAHYKDKMIEGLVTNFSSATPTDDYDLIIKNSFHNNVPIVLIITMPVQVNETEAIFLKNHPHQILSAFKTEQIVRVDLL